MDASGGFDRAALDRARLSRDPRFDGRFFIAVLSTKIYCRPICPAPSPKPQNIRYYSSAAAAAEAGFRPCLRCRPEAAPGTPAWVGTSAVVRRALRLIEAGALDSASVAALAAQVGIGPRHLHRLFVEHVGASPITVAQTRRLLFAKQLLDETALPITEVALAAGFGSVRRFNAAFMQTYGRTPRDLRRTRRRGPPALAAGDTVVRLAYRPPYDWAQVHASLTSRALPGVERVDARGYARTVAGPHDGAVVLVQPLADQHALELRLRGAKPETLFTLCAHARRTFDLGADPAHVRAAFEADPLLGPCVARRPGLRVPGSWSPFECAVRALLGERVSRGPTRAIALQLVTRLGRPFQSGEDGLTHLFPEPAALAEADLEGLGLPGPRAMALRALARATLTGALDWSAPTAAVQAALLALPGWGEGAARHVVAHGLGDPDAFPCLDPGLQRCLPQEAGKPPFSALEARAEAWRPWRAYALWHIWQARADAPHGLHAR